MEAKTDEMRRLLNALVVDCFERGGSPPHVLVSFTAGASDEQVARLARTIVKHALETVDLAYAGVTSEIIWFPPQIARLTELLG